MLKGKEASKVHSAFFEQFDNILHTFCMYRKLSQTYLPCGSIAVFLPLPPLILFAVVCMFFSIVYMKDYSSEEICKTFSLYDHPVITKPLHMP